MTQWGQVNIVFLPYFFDNTPKSTITDFLLYFAGNRDPHILLAAGVHQVGAGGLAVPLALDPVHGHHVEQQQLLQNSQCS